MNPTRPDGGDDFALDEVVEAVRRGLGTGAAPSVMSVVTSGALSAR
jgi:hypothetical protein